MNRAAWALFALGLFVGGVLGGFIGGSLTPAPHYEAFASERGVMVLNHETGVMKSREWRAQ